MSSTVSLARVAAEAFLITTQLAPAQHPKRPSMTPNKSIKQRRIRTHIKSIQGRGDEIKTNNKQRTTRTYQIHPGEVCQTRQEPLALS